MLRKVSTSTLILILLLGGILAYAAEIYSEPILFRGVEWGSTLAEATQMLPEGVEMYDLRESERWYSIDDYMYTENGFGTYSGVLGGYIYAKSSSLEGMKVAGYDVDDIKMYFTYLPDDKGLLMKDEEHTALIYAYYKIEPKDLDSAYNDLVDKLSSLYGDIDLMQHDSFMIDDRQSLWNGADGTMVSVVSRDYGSTTGTKEIYIKYAFKGGDELLNKAYEALVLEEKMNAGSNTEGL